MMTDTWRAKLLSQLTNARDHVLLLQFVTHMPEPHPPEPMQPMQPLQPLTNPSSLEVREPGHTQTLPKD